MPIMSDQRARRVAIGAPIPYRTFVVRHKIGGADNPTNIWRHMVNTSDM